MIKMVIWDLDETFWRGTLSEEKVEPIPENIELVKNLVDRGIMNSIVSKNNYDDAVAVLHEWKIDEYFIFPHISWNPKGENVKELLQECNLRAENVLFIDDNLSNLEEVKYYNPGILCETPEYIKKDILSMKEFRGKKDYSHSRLQQYRILEERTKKKNLFASNIDFLRASHIEITICTDCLNQLDRIEELIQRTNQLNYTKNRMDKTEFESMLSEDNVKAAYINAKDDFGEYGIVGFYLLKDKKLIHFLFSCRIMGFGIENYIYNKLNFPDINIIGDVATSLGMYSDIDWISEKLYVSDSTKDISKSKKDKDSLLFIGGCDLNAASRYLEMDFDVRQEFNTVIDGHGVRTSDTSQLIGAKELSKEVRKELCDNLPFMDEDVTYSTQLYSGQYKVIVISLVDDFIRSVYQNKDKDYYITFGCYWDPEGSLKEYPEEKLKYFRKHFKFAGRESTAEFKNNIEKIIRGAGDCKLVFINGIELDVSDWIGKDRCIRNIEMNAVIDEVIKDNHHIGLVDMRKIVTDRSQLIKRDNRHFDRKTYYMMAQEIMRQISEVIDRDSMRSKNMILVFINEFFMKIRRHE